MVSKVTYTDITNKQTNGESGAALVNDTKRAINEVIDLVGDIDLGGIGGSTLPVLQPRQLGDGVKTTFNTPATGTQGAKAQHFDVYLNYVYQRPELDFSIDGATGDLTFLDNATPYAPNLNDTVDIKYVKPYTFDTSSDTPVEGTGTGVTKSIGDWFGEAGPVKVTATGTTTPRSLADRFSDTINVRDFGAVGDGVTDDAGAIQAALNYANAIGGNCTVDLNNGLYRKADTSPKLTLFGVDNVTICNGTIFHDDRDTNPRVDLTSFKDCKNLSLVDLIIEGTLQDYPSETNQSQCLTGEQLTNFTMNNVTIRNVRYMATAFNRVSGATVTGCKLENILRDGIRFTRSTGVTVDGNYLKNVADDCIALHSIDGESELSSSHTVTNNTLIGCQGIKLLGGKNAVVSGNNLTLCIRNPIQVEMATTFLAEGSSQVHSVLISNNVITDSFGGYGTDYVMRVGSDAPRNYTAGATPNITVAPYDTNYNNNVLVTDINGGTAGVNISNNIIQRTRPTGVNYSSFGFGMKLDRDTTPIFTDPTIGSTDFNIHGVAIVGPTRDFTINSNTFLGMGAGRAAIRGVGQDLLSNVQHINMRIYDNSFTDIAGGCISFSGDSGAGSNQIDIYNNTFDLDPFFHSPSHNADNTWSSSGSVLGVNILNSEDVTVRGNKFKNMGSPTSSNFSGVFEDNVIYSDFVGTSDNIGNKGVRVLTRELRTNRVLPIDGDPTSSDYGKVLNNVPSASPNLPSGKFLTGTFIKNSSQNITGSYSVIGWWRLTIGSGDVLGTDWLQLKAYKD